MDKSKVARFYGPPCTSVTYRQTDGRTDTRQLVP